MPRELLLTGPRALELAPYDEPALEQGEVRCEAIASGISLGTELALYRGASPFASRRFDVDLRLFVDDASAAFPARLGYEWVGVVSETSVDELRAGERIHVTLPHRETHTFAAGDPPWISLPDELSDEHATLLQSVAITLQAVRDAQIEPGDRVAVFGLGAFGLIALQLARLEGAGEVVAVDPLPERRELAHAYGATLTLDPTASDVGLELKSAGRAADVAIEFSGRYEALQEALRCVRIAGLVVAAGFYAGGATPLRLGEEYHHNRLRMVASMQGWSVGVDRKRLRGDALELLAAGRLSVDELLTVQAPFSSAPELYARIAGQPDETLRALLTY
jgi:2-desacetyl-2-hydroxyethyl bacteriochlorophyllide A dehydrogenase